MKSIAICFDVNDITKSAFIGLIYLLQIYYISFSSTIKIDYTFAEVKWLFGCTNTIYVFNDYVYTYMFKT